MYYIGLDVHKKTISYSVKDVSGRVYQEGKIGSTRCELDYWMKTPDFARIADGMILFPQNHSAAKRSTLCR